MSVFDGFLRRFESPVLTRWLWLFALLLSLPVLGLGHVLDDLQQQSMVRGTYDSASRSATDLYCFSLGPGRGLDPSILSWWDHQDSRLCLLRPLSSASLWLDHAFLWEHPALTHLHSLLWFMGLWLAWRRVLSRYLPTNVVNLALLLTAASSFVSLSTAWIASRHALVAGCLSVWGLYHCLVGRDEDRRWREWLGLSLIALALFSSEMTIGVFGFLMAREWFTGARAGARRARWALRIGAYTIVCLVYVGVHAAFGYGSRKYPMYLDPLGAPASFIREAPERLIALAGELTLGLPSEFWLYPSVRPLVAAICVLAILAAVKAIRDLWRVAAPSLTESLRWLGCGALLSLAPCVSGMQGGRSLTIAGFPLMAVLAACFLFRPEHREVGLRARLRSLPLQALAAGALLGNPIVHFAWYGVVVQLDQAGERSFDEAQAACPADSDVYLIDASQVGATAWYARYWLKDKLAAKNYRQLTMIPTGIESIQLTRTGTSSMTLHARGGPLVGPMAMPPGTEGLIAPGLSRRYPDYEVDVKRVEQDGPAEVAFRFARALDAPELCLFVHDDARLYRIRAPAVGGSLTIRPAPMLPAFAGNAAVGAGARMLSRSGIGM
jgi:hypothetical protein